MVVQFSMVVQVFFPAAYLDQDRLYHGSQVDSQVPPL
jgi:hypothetical protein